MNHFQKIREKLNDYALDAMLFTEEANRFYASGFASSGTDGMALVTGKQDYYFTDSRYTEAAGKAIPGVQVEEISKARGYVQMLNEVFEREQIRKVGYDDSYMTVADYLNYKEKLKVELVPASAMLRELRAIKDEEEITCIVAAQRIAEKALQEILNDIKPGVTEIEIAAKLQYLMLSQGAEKMSFDPIVVSGAKSSMPHGVPGEKIMEAGDFVTMDFGCKYHGYCSDMTRTVAIGYVTEEMQKVYDTVYAAQTAAASAARGGIIGKELDGVARKIIEDAGYGKYFGHSLGHSFGVEIHESPNASPSFEKPLPVGSVITDEPGIYLPGKFGVRIEDMLYLTEGGCENLTKAPKELIIL